jgi:hypothetical protein
MWNFLLGILFVRATGTGRFVRYALWLCLIGVVIAGSIYACAVFNAAKERSHAIHDHAHNIH